MEIERTLCACGDDGYRERLLELSQIDYELKEIARRCEAILPLERMFMLPPSLAPAS